MKTNVSIASCSFLIAFAYVMAQAQDAYRHDAAPGGRFLVAQELLHQQVLADQGHPPIRDQERAV